jgi:hypothetical protein
MPTNTQLKDLALVVSGHSGCDKWQSYPNVRPDAEESAHRRESRQAA